MDSENDPQYGSPCPPIVPDVLAHKGAPLRALRSDPCRLRATGPPEVHKEPPHGQLAATHDMRAEGDDIDCLAALDTQRINCSSAR